MVVCGTKRKASQSDQLKRLYCNYPNGSYNGIFKTQPVASQARQTVWISLCFDTLSFWRLIRGGSLMSFWSGSLPFNLQLTFFYSMQENAERNIHFIHSLIHSLIHGSICLLTQGYSGLCPGTWFLLHVHICSAKDSQEQ